MCHYKQSCTPFFPCEMTLLNISHDRKGISKFSHTELQLFMITAEVLLFQFEKISINEFGGPLSSNWANSWQVFWGRQVKHWIFREQILVMFLLTYLMLKLIFNKIKSFLVKGLYLNFVKKLSVSLKTVNEVHGGLHYPGRYYWCQLHMAFNVPSANTFSNGNLCLEVLTVINLVRKYVCYSQRSNKLKMDRL